MKKVSYFLAIFTFILIGTLYLAALAFAQTTDYSECRSCHGEKVNFTVDTSPQNCAGGDNLKCHASYDYLRNTVHNNGTVTIPSAPNFWNTNAWYGYGTFQEPDPINTVYSGTIHNYHRPQGYGCTLCHAYYVWVTNFDTTYVDCKLCHISVPHETMGTATGQVTPVKISVLNNIELGTNTKDGQLNWIYWKEYTCVNEKCHGLLQNPDRTFKDNYRRPQCNECHTTVNKEQHVALHTPNPPLTGTFCESCHINNLPNEHSAHINPSTAQPYDCNVCHAATARQEAKNAIQRYKDTGIKAGCPDCHLAISPALDNAHVDIHGTQFPTDPPLNCAQCHQPSRIPQSLNQPNLQDFHIEKITTSYPLGMDCNSCHNYAGTKLSKTRIDTAISTGDKSCGGCHDLHDLATLKHDTVFITGTTINCASCHKPVGTPTSTNSNLQDIHVGKSTTSYPAGMDCNSCHDYTGTKLVKLDIETAIATGDTQCNACHKAVDTQGHEVVHATNFDSSYPGAASLCSSCHITDSSDLGPYTLWDVHIDKKSTSFASMDCDSCHSYTGVKSSKSAIDTAIASGSKDCKACHTAIGGHAISEHSTLPTSVHSASTCDSCHPRATATVAKPGLPNSSLTTIPGANLCFTCHKSGGTAPDVQSSFMRTFRHKSPKCDDCHNPHQEDKSTAQAPAADGSLKGISGVAVTNGPAGTSPTFTLLASVNNEYELCFKCHSSYAGTLPPGTQDKAIEFNLNNPSFHPVEGTGKNLNIRDQAFAPGTPWNPTTGDDPDYSANSAKVYCTDCHGSDNPLEPKGPHGSNNSWILKANFVPFTFPQKLGFSITEANALCFKCHSYDVYINGLPGSRFKYHKLMANDRRVGCYGCHDIHGRSDLPHLIRIKSAGEKDGVNSFTHTSSGGTCYPSCHGDKEYKHEYAHVTAPPPPPPPGEGNYADQGLWIQKLSSQTSSDSSGELTDITSYLRDNKFDKWYEVRKSSDDNRVIAVKFNQEAKQYSQVVLRLYVDETEATSRIYAYSSDANTLNTSRYVEYKFQKKKGWTDIDVTSVASLMNGYGWMKFRATTNDKSIKISEVQITLTAK